MCFLRFECPGVAQKPMEFGNAGCVRISFEMNFNPFSANFNCKVIKSYWMSKIHILALVLCSASILGWEGATSVLYFCYEEQQAAAEMMAAAEAEAGQNDSPDTSISKKIFFIPGCRLCRRPPHTDNLWMSIGKGGFGASRTGLLTSLWCSLTGGFLQKNMTFVKKHDCL